MSEQCHCFVRYLLFEAVNDGRLNSRSQRWTGLHLCPACRVEKLAESVC